MTTTGCSIVQLSGGGKANGPACPLRLVFVTASALDRVRQRLIIVLTMAAYNRTRTITLGQARLQAAPELQTDTSAAC